MAKRYYKRCSTSLVIREMQIKTKMTHHLALVSMSIFKGDDKCWLQCGEKKKPSAHWWDYKLAQPLWKTIWWILKKLKLELPEVLLLGKYPKETKTLTWKDICTYVSIAALFTIAETWKQFVSINSWRKKLWCVCVCVYIYIYKIHIHNGMLFSHKKKWGNCTIVSTRMDLEVIMISEVKWVRERQITHDLTYVLLLFRRSVMSDSLLLHRLQHSKLPGPSRQTQRKSAQICG